MVPAVPVIRDFRGEYAFLSNFFVSSNGRSVEHYYQAAKTTDPDLRARIIGAFSPGQAKRRGRAVDLRPDWEEVKVPVMAALVWRKFQIPEMRARLVETGVALLVEGNWWHDSEWGDCSCGNCPTGKNHLGVILMTTRAAIQGGHEPRASA